MEDVSNEEVIVTDEDTKEEDLYDGSLYPYPRETDIDDIEVDVREDPFPVTDLIRKFDKKTLITNPEFQRNLVWKPDQRSRFIESILLNIPLPPLYLNQDRRGRYIVVDGLQRTTTLYDFVNNRYPLQDLQALPWLNGKKFSELESKLQTRIEDRKLLCFIIKPTVPSRMIYDIFKRINTGGTQLNRQEIRNCIYLGKATGLLKEISKQKYFRQAIDWGISETRMKDREAVLRYIAFRMADYEKDYLGDMDDFLGKAMIEINKMDGSEIEEIKGDFRRVMEWSYKIFKKKNFRILTDYSRGRINIAVMESVCRFLSDQEDKFLKKNGSKIAKNFERLLNDSDYYDSVRFSTGDKARVTKRFKKAAEILGSK